MHFAAKATHRQQLADTTRAHILCIFIRHSLHTVENTKTKHSFLVSQPIFTIKGPTFSAFNALYGGFKIQDITTLSKDESV